MVELYEIDLHTYKDAIEDTRLLVSEVTPTANVHPFNISTNLQALVKNVTDYQETRSLISQTQRGFGQELRKLKGRSTGYPFFATAKIRGTYLSLGVLKLGDDEKSSHITVQTTSLFDLIKYHPLNSGFLDSLLRNENEIIEVARHFLWRFKKLHPSDIQTCANHPIILGGVCNAYRFSAKRTLGHQNFIVHSLKINDEWQNIGDYWYYSPTRDSIIYHIDLTYDTSTIYLKPEDGGRSFIQDVTEKARQLVVWKATNGIILTPISSSGLPMDERFWFKKKAVSITFAEPDRWWSDYQKESAERHAKLRVEAQVFAERFCTDERLHRAWRKATVLGSGSLCTDRSTIGGFIEEIHRLESTDIDESEWVHIDWTRVFPRIDRIARAWALVKVDALRAGTTYDHGRKRSNLDDEEALETTQRLRQGVSPSI